MQNNPFKLPKYLEKFGLKEPPYTTNPDERYLYLTDIHQEAINMIGHIIEDKEGAGLIVGEQGTGKTTIMRRTTSILRPLEEFEVAVVETAEHSPTLFQLTKEIIESFGLNCVGRDTQTRIDQLKHFLLDVYKQQKIAVLLIDEAQQMSGGLLESLRGFLNFEDPRGGKLLQIILFSMPSINRKLRNAPSFRNRLIKTELEKINRREMENMLIWRFKQAGGRGFPFDREALDFLYQFSNGNPRTICGIAKLALQFCAVEGNSFITKNLIQKISEKRYV